MAWKKKLSKSKRLRTKLIDRINEADSFPKLKKLSRTLEYYPVLSEDADWDFMFLVRLIRFKLNRMAKYFETAEIVENSKELAKQIRKAIELMNIGYFDYIDNNAYVNVRNTPRFISKVEIDLLKKMEDGYLYEVLRAFKAK